MIRCILYNLTKNNKMEQNRALFDVQLIAVLCLMGDLVTLLACFGLIIATVPWSPPSLGQPPIPGCVFFLQLSQTIIFQQQWAFLDAHCLGTKNSMTKMLKFFHIGPTCWFEVLAIEEVARAKRDEKTEKDKKSWWSPHLQLWGRLEG